LFAAASSSFGKSDVVLAARRMVIGSRSRGRGRRAGRRFRAGACPYSRDSFGHFGAQRAGDDHVDDRVAGRFVAVAGDLDAAAGAGRGGFGALRSAAACSSGAAGGFDADLAGFVLLTSSLARVSTPRSRAWSDEGDRFGTAKARDGRGGRAGAGAASGCGSAARSGFGSAGRSSVAGGGSRLQSLRQQRRPNAPPVRFLLISSSSWVAAGNAGAGG
jgi:hypothetical protein